MYVKIIYFDHLTRSYSGKEYTYLVDDDLPITPFTKVLCPTPKGVKRALVTEINVPESELDTAWADKVKEITEIDYE